ncbi:pectinesterase family protein [Marinigracilibium pacificum]|uniref:Pectinesterase n=1 Tax=Marinigracilibium pacificum TaxID=2729599 RepID=A0A848J9I0_9BACT|nr:pectinesterase family protein [Marinigracilibium pacificum]NMM49702.1 pectin esterase [Marinigracilibium pacificum]
MKIKLLLMLSIFGVLIEKASAQVDYFISVAADGSGDFHSIQAAIDNTKAFPDKRITIFVKKGIYREKVRVYSWNPKLTIRGEDKEKTIIIYDDHFNKINRGRNSTFHTPTLIVEANDCRLENLTIINDAGPVGQAVALAIIANRVVVENCDIKGNQDTLYCAGEGSKQYFNECYIEGTTDFIFGEATVVFENSTIKCLGDSYITAASTPENTEFGFVFLSCEIIADEKVTDVYLGRPWRSYAKTAYINCSLGRFINPEGWHDWSKKDVHHLSYYAEYLNTGEGADTEERVEWAYFLTKEQVTKYTKENILEDESHKFWWSK